MDLIQQLKALKPGKVYSQTGEEFYLDCIFEHIGFTNKVLVDLGAGDGTALSTTKYLAEKYNCKRILIDGDSHGNKEVQAHWITCHNIRCILAGLDCPYEPDLLSIDLDGNDFFILRKILQTIMPRVIIAEFNGFFPIAVSRTIAYNPSHRWNEDDYYGFSLGLALKLAAKTGYKIVFQNDSQNIYMLRKDLIENPEAEIDLAFKPAVYHPHNSIGKWLEL